MEDSILKKKSGWDYIDLFHRAAYNKLTQEDWEEIRNVLEIYIPYEENNQVVKNRGNKLLFGKNELDDVDSVLNMQDNENNNEENENDDSSDSDKSDNEENEFDDSFEDECFIY